jgi:bacteriocin biosynthesis cyclodehydratase domain-containing protein
MSEVVWQERTLHAVPFLRVLRDGPEACHLLTSERTTFRVQGHGVPFLLDEVLPSFDAPLRVGALSERLTEQVEEDALRALLGALLRNGILRDVTEAPPLSSGDRAEHRDTLSLLSRLSDRPEALLATLREARVLVACDSPWGDEVAEALRSTAIGAVRLVATADSMEAEVEAATVAVGLQDGDFTGTQMLTALNRACVSRGRSLLHARLTLDADGFLGPWYEPGGACLECLRLRIRNNLRSGREVALAERQVDEGRLPADRLSFSPFRRQLAAMVAVEVLKQVTALEPSSLYCGCRVVDLLTHESQLHPVLRHPACEACGRQPSGRLYPWDEDAIQVERMLIPLEEQ